MKKKMDKKIAVALKMDEYGRTVPRVSASAMGQLADRIIEIARENNIPIYEDQDLADSLRYLDIGMALPEELFPVVAEIIAHIHFIARGYREAPLNPRSKKLN